MIEHHDDKAEVNERDHNDNSPKSLHWCKEIHALWSQVRETTKE
jgi:hypothetical protein